MHKNGLVRHAARQLDAVEYEVAQEKAAALHRIGKRLDDALLALRTFDAAATSGEGRTGGEQAERASLVAAAAEALWYFVVQREACGLRDSEAVMCELQVPREVQLRMGVRKQ